LETSVINSENTRNGLIIELVSLFIVLPIVLALPIHIGIKLLAAGVGLVFIIYHIVVSKLYRNIFSFVSPKKSFVKRMLFIGLSIFFGGAIMVYYYDSSLLFSIVKNKPHIWIIILFVYAFLSVIPQEIIYRHFFFKRYETIFKDKNMFLLLNMFCFSLCHLFLLNIMVLLLTFIGGGLFAYTYQRENSMLWVCAEHTLYGYLIFTLGLGEMLAFPT
jgi:membrane protease YdiL (CAAX protease family)